MSWFETRSSEVVHDGFSRVRVDRVLLPDGTEGTREVVEHRDAVAMVPVTSDGGVLLVKQYRHALGGDLLEIPAGILDHQEEPPEVAAQRELIEEIGRRAGRLRHLVTFANSAGWTDEHTHVYLATELTPAAPPADFRPEAEEAAMEVVRFEVADAIELARTGRLTDAKTLVGLLLAAPHLGAA